MLYDRIIFCKKLDTKLHLTKYMEANYGLTKNNRKSSSGWFFYLISGLIS